MLCRAGRREHDRLVACGARVVAVVAAALVFGAASLSAQDQSSPRSHTVKRGDTLWDLARLYLGDSYLWPEIYRLNTDVIDDPHWIYPGEVLRLPAPGAAGPVVAEGPKAEEPPRPDDPARPDEPPTSRPPATREEPPGPPGELDGPTIFPKPRSVLESTARQRVRAEAPQPTVPVSAFLAAPFVDRAGGPRGAGSIVKLVSLSMTIAGRDARTRLQQSDEILIMPPAGSAAAEGERYVTYIVGPYIEDLGQVVIPTGIVQVTRAPRSSESAVANVVRIFGQIDTDQRLMPYDSTALQLTSRPQPVSGASWSNVKLVVGTEIMPSIQDYLVIDASSQDGVKLGDEFLLFQPRRPSDASNDVADPEVPIARGQAIRVTPYATTLMITGQRHPKIQVGTMARRTAAMP